MGDFTTGYTFVSGEKNITHAKLNQQINNATANAALITGKPSAGTIVGTDLLLLYSSGDMALRSANLNNLVFNHADLLNSRPIMTGATAPVKEDYVFMQDISEVAPGYARATLQKAVFDSAELIANRTANDTPAAGDEVLVKDAGAATFKRVTRSKLLGYNWPALLPFNDALLTALAVPLAADHLLVWDTTGSANKALPLANLFSGPSAPAGGVADADLLLIYDTSGTCLAKLTAALLKPFGAPSQIPTAPVTGAIPAYNAGPPPLLTMAHGLAGVPQCVRVVLECTTADGNWHVGDEIDVNNLYSGAYSHLFNVYVDATNVNVLRNSGYDEIWGLNKDTGAVNQALTRTSWRLKAYCVYFA
jgi:hypothetical protein